MKVVWVTRSFLDYRIPVYAKLSKRVNGNLYLFYNADYVPDRCNRKVQDILGSKAIGLRGERAGQLGAQNGFANRGLRIPYQKGLVRAIRNEKPDVLVSDGFFQWTYAALWIRATKRIPHVMCYERTAHTERNAQWYRRQYRKAMMRWIDAMCCNGRLCGEYVQSMGFPGDRITYGHMVADVEGMERAIASVSEQQVAALAEKYKFKGLVFLYVGQLIHRKGIRQLFEAWQECFGDKLPDQGTLLLVGDGPQRSELEAYCKRAGLRNIRFVGQVDYDSLAPYFKLADVFVIPTLEDNWSLVVPEAMACGLPILCSKFNGCWPELVTPKNGWVFDPLNIKETAGILRECTEKRSILPVMGKNSLSVIQNHTAVQAVDGIVEACEIAMRRRHKRNRLFH